MAARAAIVVSAGHHGDRPRPAAALPPWLCRTAQKAVLRMW